MLKLKCDRCKKPITQPAALVFSPPSQDNKVDKFHVCLECWIELALFVQGVEFTKLIGTKPKPSKILRGLQLRFKH